MTCKPVCLKASKKAWRSTASLSSVVVRCVRSLRAATPAAWAIPFTFQDGSCALSSSATSGAATAYPRRNPARAKSFVNERSTMTWHKARLWAFTKSAECSDGTTLVSVGDTCLRWGHLSPLSLCSRNLPVREGVVGLPAPQAGFPVWGTGNGPCRVVTSSAPTQLHVASTNSTVEYSSLGKTKRQYASSTTSIAP